MNSRFWFYLGAVIVVAGLGATHLANNRRVANEQIRIESESLEGSQQALDSYLEKQTDSRKMVQLAIVYSKTRPELVEPVALRAFELNQNNRDIALLAAPYSEVAKERVKILDPLFDESAQ